MTTTAGRIFVFHVFVFVFVFVYEPNVIEPCAPGVSTDDEHPGLSHQLDQSAPVLGSHLIVIIIIIVIMVMVVMKTIIMVMMMMMMKWMMTIDRFEGGQVTPASRA